MDTVRMSGKEPKMHPMRKSSLTLWAFALALLVAWFITSCADDDGVEPLRQPPTAVSIVPTESAPRLHDRVVEPTPSPFPAPIPTPSPVPQEALATTHSIAAHSSLDIYLGSSGLNERIYYAAVIARVKLKSTTASAELAFTRENGSKLYQGVVTFTFEALEYLKGSGGDELLAVATVDLKSDVIQSIMDRNARGEYIYWDSVDRTKPYTSMELALEAAKKWQNDRITTWDGREAIVMVRERLVPGVTDGSKRYWIGAIYDYAIDTYNRVWLPAAKGVGAQSVSGQAQAQGETRYLLGPPSGDRAVVAARAALTDATASPTQPATISLSELKTEIAEFEQWRKAGKGVRGYESCILQSIADERLTNGFRERGLTRYLRWDHSLSPSLSIDSGMSKETVVFELPDLPGKTWLDGDDKELFDIAPNTNNVFRTTRPLPAGEYAFFSNFQRNVYIPCNYLPLDAKNTLENFVLVTAPADALHEAFFDPVAISTAVGADATNGVLKPASLDVDDTKKTTLDSIAWEKPRVTMECSPSTLPANNYVDFIALDGSVTLRLDVDDATKSVDGDVTTLTWGVCKQPWKAGDKLMLRISKSPADLTGATNDLDCDGTPIPTLTPVPSPTPIPSPTPAPTATPAAGAPKATLLGNGGIRLTWGAKTGATQYKIAFRTPGSSWGWSELGGPKITTNSKNLGIYACGITLIFRVRPKLANGNWGNWSPASSPYTKPCS